jgi:hypothetical protein
LTEFFHEQLSKYLQPGLDTLGRVIIDSCLDGGTVEEFAALLEGKD